MSEELSAHDTSIFLFPDDNFSKYEGIFTKLDMCIDIVDIWFGIATGQILPICDRVLCPWHDNGGDYRFTFFIFSGILYKNILLVPI